MRLPDTRALRDPRMLLLLVPVVALLLLVVSGHGARPMTELAAAATTTTTTTTTAPAPSSASASQLPDVAVEDATTSRGHSAGRRSADTATRVLAATESPEPVVNEASSPAVLGIVGVGVAVVAVNGAVLFRRRVRRGDHD
ncbi:MAG: hypothetical protein U0Q22_11950 [Acidimicrobiales bacterium]